MPFQIWEFRNACKKSAIRTRFNPRFHGSIAPNRSFHHVKLRPSTAHDLSCYGHFLKTDRIFRIRKKYAKFEIFRHFFCVFATQFWNSENSTRLQKKLIIWRITRRLKSLFLEIKAEIPGHWSVKARLQTEIKTAASYVGFVLNFSFFFFFLEKLSEFLPTYYCGRYFIHRQNVVSMIYNNGHKW